MHVNKKDLLKSAIVFLVVQNFLAGVYGIKAPIMGAMVTGLDGLAGRDYMRSGENCLVGSVKDLRLLPDIVHQAFTDEALAERCAEAGRKTAQAYGRSAFKTAWLAQLSQFLRMEPANV
jgi:hypothetical protein